MWLKNFVNTFHEYDKEKLFNDLLADKLNDSLEAEKILRDAEVTHNAFCTLDPQVTLTARKAGDGLYANLAKGEIPDYLEVIDETANSALQIYRLK